MSRPRRRPMLAADTAQKPYGTADRRDRCDAPPGSVSKVEMTTPMALICKALFPSISTFETPPQIFPPEIYQVLLGVYHLTRGDAWFPRPSAPPLGHKGHQRLDDRTSLADLLPREGANSMPWVVFFLIVDFEELTNNLSDPCEARLPHHGHLGRGAWCCLEGKRR